MKVREARAVLVADRRAVRVVPAAKVALENKAGRADPVARVVLMAAIRPRPIIDVLGGD